jgi:hypothetical protein
MARLSVLAKDQLTPEFAALAEQAEAFNIHATVSQVLAHCPDMTQAFFQFLFTLARGRGGGPSDERTGASQGRPTEQLLYLTGGPLRIGDA